MSMSLTLERTLTQLDHVRLTKLLAQLPPDTSHADEEASEAMSELLAASDVLPSHEVPSDLVTMYSQVMLADTATGQRYNLTLCYPRDAEPGAGFVSVLSPVGMALLGMRCGSEAQWQAPNGLAVSVNVLEVMYQPEASGDYLT